MICSWKSCPSSKVIVDDAVNRVEIKGSIPKKLRTQKTLDVSWRDDGNAVFHESCWRQVESSATDRVEGPRKRRKVSLSKTDSDLLKEAKAIIDASETAEYHHATSVVEEAGRQIAELIQKSSRCVFFTGAGISTAAGIGDYRGKEGKWTEMDRETQSDDDEDADNGVPYESLRPTFSHEAIAKLVTDRKVKFVITQNCDDLHGLSGIPAECLAELHGNAFVERCTSCKSRYRRNAYVLDDEASEYFEATAKERSKMSKENHWIRCKTCGLSHHTGRRCERPECGALLIDTIINFGDDLEEDILSKASDIASESDLLICFGTTISVTPASDLVKQSAKRKGCKVVICNRQVTDIDKYADVRVFGDCDPLARTILRNLLDVQEYEQWSEDKTNRLRKYDLLRQQSEI